MIVQERIAAHANDRSIKVELTNADLPRMVMGRAEDELELRPFEQPQPRASHTPRLAVLRQTRGHGVSSLTYRYRLPVPVRIPTYVTARRYISQETPVHKLRDTPQECAAQRRRFD